MTQYVIQILISPEKYGEDIFQIGYLGKSFIVTESCPIPSVWPSTREQVVMTNADSFNGIVSAFENYGGMNLSYSYDSVFEQISVTGAYYHTWPKD